MVVVMTADATDIDIEAVGRKGRDFLRRRFPAAKVQTRSLADLAESMEAEPELGERVGEFQITGEHVGILGKVEFAQASALARNVIARYKREEIDAVYVVFNEFKSVIAQRLIVEDCADIFTAVEKATYVWRSNVKGYVHTPLRERNPLFAEMRLE